MKKIFTILLLLFLSVTQSAFSFSKKADITIPEGSGYVGTLPNVTERFQKFQPEESKPSYELQEMFNDQNGITPAPTNDPAFINIIMKKDKTSQYINDLRDIIVIIEKIQTCIEDEDNIQKFNAKTYYLKESVKYLKNKYQNRAEGSYISYRKLLQLNSHIQAVSQLRVESEIYTPYLTSAQNGNLFTQNNINTQLDYLLAEIKDTLVVLKEAK